MQKARWSGLRKVGRIRIRSRKRIFIKGQDGRRGPFNRPGTPRIGGHGSLPDKVAGVCAISPTGCDISAGSGLITVPIEPLSTGLRSEATEVNARGCYSVSTKTEEPQ